MAETKYDLDVKISEHELKHLINMYAERVARSLFSNVVQAREFIVNARRFNTLLDELEKLHAK